VHVYADTVELADHLVLPGKSVGIFARRVKLTKSASIDVTGPSAKDNYKPGDLPQQKDVAQRVVPALQTIELHFNGHAFGRRALRSDRPNRDDLTNRLQVFEDSD
jgi:hypothetical protein